MEVIQKNSEGWWYVSINGREGWVPSTFIEETSPSMRKPDRPKPPRPHNSPAEKRKQQQQQSRKENMLVAIASYDPPVYEDSGIALVCGEQYELITNEGNGWCFVKKGSKEGWAPASYLE